MARIVTFQVRFAKVRIGVADGGGFAGEDEPPTGLQHPDDFAQRQLDIGDVVQHRVADDQVEGVVVIGNALRIGDPPIDVQTETGRCGWRP